MYRLCDDIIEDDFEKSDKKKSELIEKETFINLNSNSSDFFEYTFDENVGNIEYLVSKKSNLYSPKMSTLKFFQTLKNIKEEYKQAQKKQ